MDEEELLRRLNRADAAACLALGRTKALEYGLRFFIAAHPDPESAKEAWQRLLVVIADEHLNVPEAIPDAPMYEAGIQQGLAVITGQFEVMRKAPE